MDGRQFAARVPGDPRGVVGLTRQTSQEVERDSDGLPRYVASVLVGGKDYYNYRYEDRGQQHVPHQL